MIYSLCGLALAGAGGAGFWHFRPTNGQAHPAMDLPYLDLLIPVTIVMAVLMGILLIAAGVTVR
jgi:hypothetical protein